MIAPINIPDGMELVAMPPFIPEQHKPEIERLEGLIDEVSKMLLARINRDLQLHCGNRVPGMEEARRAQNAYISDPLLKSLQMTLADFISIVGQPRMAIVPIKQRSTN